MVCRTIPGQPIIGGQTVEDPKQGTLPNCTFIAALSSATWMNKQHTDFNLYTISGINAYKIKFCDQRVNTLYEVLIDDCLLDYGATSSTNANEMWPALYEKAYAIFCQYIVQGVPIPTTPWHDVTVRSDDQGLPLTLTLPDQTAFWVADISALEHISRMKRGTTNPILTDNKTGTQILNEVKGICDSYGKTYYPTIGWMKSTAYIPAPPATCSCSSANPKLVYSNDGHTYSILGVYPSKTNAKYIVLKDPTCATITGPLEKDVNGQDIINWKYNLRGNTLTMNQNGIFTIHPDKFQCCFYSYQYVKTLIC